MEVCTFQRAVTSMLTNHKLIAASVAALCTMSLAACGTKLKDIRVVSVKEVDLKDQTQLRWLSPKPRPSILVSRIDFSTNKDLLHLARKYRYNVSFMVGLCGTDGVRETVRPYSGVYWDKLRISYRGEDKELPGYAEAIDKGPPFTYQVYVERLPPNPPGLMCITLAGGAMFGGSLRSNDAVIPIGSSAP